MTVFSERKLSDLRKRKISKIGTNLDKLDSLLGITTDVRRDYSYKSTMNPKGWETMEDGRMVHQDDMYLHQVDKDSGEYEIEEAQSLSSKGDYETVIQDRNQFVHLLRKEDWNELEIHLEAFTELLFSIDGISPSKLERIFEEIQEAIGFVIKAEEGISKDTTIFEGIDQELHYLMERIKTIEVFNEPILRDLKESRFFEKLVCLLFEKMGFNTDLTRASRDGGIDVVTTGSPREIGTKYLIECKRYKMGNSVGVKDIRALLGVKHSEGATKGILVTTSVFSLEAITYANEHPWEIELIDYKKLIKLIVDNFSFN